MKKKMISMVLLGAVALWLAGCGEDEPGVTDDQKGATSQAPTTGEGGVQPVPQGPGDTAGTTTPGGAGTAQERNQYVQGAEQILNGIEEKLTAIQQQTGTAGQEGRQKVQELTKQVQEQLADARAAVENMKNVTGTQLKDAKLAADLAIQNTQEALKNLQTQVGTQITQAQ